MVNIDSKKKTNVISFPNEFGKDVFGSFLIGLGEKAKEDIKKNVRFAFILKALDYMQFVDFSDLPRKLGQSLSTTLDVTVDGHTYVEHLKLVKPLNKENIYELRISIRHLNWHFRGIFFPVRRNASDFYCFVFPLEKSRQVHYNLTDHYRDKAYNILEDLKENPDKYKSYFENN